MKFKVLFEEEPVEINSSKLLFGVMKEVPNMNENEGVILVSDGNAPSKRKPDQKIVIADMYPIGICNLTKIKKLKKETNSKDDNEFFNKIVKDSVGVVDITETFK